MQDPTVNLRRATAGRPVTKAVIPAAGLGTRFLPATKATPKEMLPVVDKPAIQYVVEEAAAAGLTDVLMVTGRSKRALEDHFDRNYELEEALASRGDTDRLALVQEPADLATVHYVRQGDPLGLGHAVLCAAQHVGDEPFAVLLGDDLIDASEDLLERMIAVQQAHGGTVVALIEVDESQIHLYGCAAVEAHRRRRRRAGHRPGGEAAARDGAEQPRRDRALRAGPGGLRRAARDAARSRAARSSSPTRCGCSPNATTTVARSTASCSPAAATTPGTAPTSCGPW